VEWEELIFHKREPAYVVEVDTCASDPGTPTQYYSSSCSTCGDVISFLPVADGNGNFVLAANTVTCSGNLVTHAEISAATISALITALNNDGGTGALGTWVADGSNILLTETDCTDVTLNWVV
jgi:hypothetical protein